MNNYLKLFIVTFILFGCATRAEREYTLMDQAFNDAIAQYELCLDKINANQSVNYVYENIVIDKDNSSNKYQLLSSTQTINDEMKSHLIAFLNENNKCRKVAIEGLSKVHLSLATVYIDLIRNIDNLFGRILSGEINIGEFNRLRQEKMSASDKEWGTTVNNLKATLENEHNNEIASRQRAAAALQNFSIQQQQLQQNQILYNNLNRPRTTNCNMIGNYVNCTSY